MARRSRKVARLIMAGAFAIVTCATIVVTQPAMPAQAVGTYNNVKIVDYALSKVGQSGGECREFVNHVVGHIGGQNVSSSNGGYFGAFTQAGGIELDNNSQLIPGDIVQYYADSNNLHTWIIVSREANGQFWVVDSNQQRDRIVRTYKRNAFTILKGSNTRGYRMGSVPTLYRVSPFAGNGAYCLDADLFSMGVVGTKIHLWSCNANKNQKWYWDGERLRNVAGARCLDADTLTINGNGTKMQLWDCSGSSNQNWHRLNSTVRNRWSPRCLDADNGSFGNGGKVHLWDCYGGANQLWSFTPTNLNA